MQLQTKLFLLLVLLCITTTVSGDYVEYYYEYLSNSSVYHYNGQDSRNVGNVDTVEACAQKCLDDQNCKVGFYMLHGGKSGECHLANTKSNISYGCPGLYSCKAFQKKERIIEEPVEDPYNQLPNQDYTQINNRFAGNIGSLQGCKDYCSNDDKCAVLLYVPSGERSGYCYVGDAVSEPQPCGTACVSYEKKDKPVYVPPPPPAFLDLAAERDFNLLNNRQVGPVGSKEECQQKCKEDDSCILGLYVYSGYKEGECWIADTKRVNPIACTTPCYPFVKREYENGQDDYFVSLPDQDYNYAGNKNVGPVNSELECRAACQVRSDCYVGLYVNDGNRKGECWLSPTIRSSPIACGTPCKSFKKNFSFAQLPNEDFNLSGNKQVGPVGSEDECKQKCQFDGNCVVGLYVSDGSRKGECWIAKSKRQNSVPCGTPCKSFEKV